jgi:thioredoxin-related protein
MFPLNSRWAKGWLIVALAAVTMLAVPPKPRAESPGIAWQNYGTGIGQARWRGLPVILYFWAQGCRPCELFEQQVLTDPEIVAYVNARFIPIKLDYDAEMELVKQYRVRGTPTLVFLTPDAKTIDSLLGYIQRDQLLKVLHFVGDGAYKTTSFREYLK